MENIIEALEWALNNTKPERPELQSDHFNILTNALNEAKNLSLNSTPSDEELYHIAEKLYPKLSIGGGIDSPLVRDLQQSAYVKGAKDLRDTFYPACKKISLYDETPRSVATTEVTPLTKETGEIEWTSEAIIGRVRDRHKELKAKGWDYSAFYNGWLEGRVDMLQQCKWNPPLSVGKSVGSDNREAVGFYKFVTENYFEKNTVFFSYDSHAYVDFEKYGETDEPFFTLEQLYQEFKSKQ
jgi:hypothetical protein